MANSALIAVAKCRLSMESKSNWSRKSRSGSMEAGSMSGAIAVNCASMRSEMSFRAGVATVASRKALRIAQRGCDRANEARAGTSVSDSMIARHGQLENRADSELAIDHPWALRDCACTNDRDLRRI